MVKRSRCWGLPEWLGVWYYFVPKHHDGVDGTAFQRPRFSSKSWAAAHHELPTSAQMHLRMLAYTWVRSTIVDPRYWDFTRNETTAEMRLHHQTVQILIWDAWRCGPDTPMLKDFRSDSSIREWSIAVWLCNTGWWWNKHLEKWWSSSMVGGIIPYFETTHQINHCQSLENPEKIPINYIIPTTNHNITATLPVYEPFFLFDASKRTLLGRCTVTATCKELRDSVGTSILDRDLSIYSSQGQASR